MWNILRRNLFSPIIFIIALLVAVLLVIHQKSDAFFLSATIIFNALVGIFQELRARTALRKLEILNAPVVRRIASTGIERILTTLLHIGDHLLIQSGDQVPADGILIQSHSLNVNEALITGEAQDLSKSIGSTVLAGSLVTAGNAEMRVTALGARTTAGKMSSQLKKYVEKVTPLQRSLNSLITYLTYAAIAISLLILVTGHEKHSPITVIINTVIAGAISIVPEGLILASTLLLSFGAIKLARSGVIIQRIAAIEGLSRLDTLCLDKTGTITTNHLILESVVPVSSYTKEEVLYLLGILVHNEPQLSPTIEALLPHVEQSPNATVVEFLSFSSSRKWSAVCAHHNKRTLTIAMGAPEVIQRYQRLQNDVLAKIREYTVRGLRVLLVMDYSATFSAEQTLSRLLDTIGKPIGIIVLKQELRPNILDTLFYLQAQGVRIKILSGDAPHTVQFIAHLAGVLHTENVITGDELALLTDAEWPHIVEKYSIFARVLPEQKERIIRNLQLRGYVGMVGDGVNDALAIKQADLGVAMFDGSPAARRIADIILLNNDFAIFPFGMKIGAQIILGLELVTGSYFNRIIAGLTILFLSLFLTAPYPFFPTHLVLLNLITVAIPSLLWSLFPPKTTKRYDPNHFFSDTWKFAIPNGLITGFAVLIGYSVARHLYPLSLPLARSMALTVMAGLGMVTFMLLPSALRAIDSMVLRRFQVGYLCILPTMFILFIHLPRFQLFFRLKPLTLTGWLYSLIIIAIAGLLQFSALRRPEQYLLST